MSPPTRHSRFIAGTKRAVTNPIPSMMMTTVATFSSVARCACSVWPTPVAPTPNRMKTDEKVATNSRLGISTRRSEASARSTGRTPLTAER